MKKYLVFATALLGGLVACQRESMPVTTVSEDSTITFAATMPSLKAEEGTKTEWTGETLQWSANDQIRMAYTVAGEWQGASDEKPTPAKLYASTRLTEATHYAEFNVNTNFTTTATGTHVFYGLYPGELSGADFPNAPVASITIPAEQTPTANSFDAAADVMVGVSEEWAKKPTAEEKVLLTWTRQVAHADLTIKNLAINEGETISTITFTAQEGADLVGQHDIDITTGEISNPKGSTNEIVVKADKLTYADNTIKVWVSMLPATITELTVCVETDKATYTRSFTGISREFKKNMRNTMNIGMTSAVREEIATDLTDYEEPFSTSLGEFTIEKETLSEGLTYVWTSDTKNKCAKASAYVSKTNYAAVSYLVSPELEIGSNKSKLTFNQAANYLNNEPFDDYFTVVVFEGENETTLDLDVLPDGKSWTFVNTTVDLSAYKGKTIKIGFKYTSTSSLAGTWEIKNFKVTDVKATAPVITVDQNVFDAPEEGGDYTIGVTVQNIDGVISAEASADWIELGTINNENVVFEVLPNDGAARTATITLSYEGAEDVVVTVNQEGAVDVIFSLYSGELSEGDYVIVYDGRAMNTTIDKNRLQFIEPTISDNKITNPDASIIWHIAANGDYWTIFNEAANKYAAGNGTKNQAALNDNGTVDNSLWTASGSETYEFVNKLNASKEVNANLRNNGTYGFACYGTSTGGALSLYKLN